MESHNLRPITPLSSADNDETLARLCKLMERQLEVLQQIDARQTAADNSKQPIPQAPALSNGAWLPLLKSFRDHIDPTIERARSGLDALLVFIGLFSAIVTAFFVESSKELDVDQAERTNDLLANLTDALLAIHGTNVTALNLGTAEQFVVPRSSVRFNIYLSMSLILSLAGAVLAIICRGFLSSLTWSRFRDASRKLTDIHKRWDSAEKYLFPLVQVLMPSTIVPVLLFIAGLLDHMFALWEITRWSDSDLGPVLFFEVTLLVLVMTLVFVLGAHGIYYRDSSPFQSIVSRFLLLSRRWAKPPSKAISPDQVLAFHKALQHCHDDDLLDQAATSVSAMVKSSESLYHPEHQKDGLAELENSEMDMLLHLLSVESSFRTNLTAASTILERGHFLGPSKTEIWHRLFSALILAGGRFADRYGKDFRRNWNSPFTSALAKLARNIFLDVHATNLPRYANALTFMFSNYGRVMNVPPLFVVLWMCGSLPKELQPLALQYGYKTLLAHASDPVTGPEFPNPMVWDALFSYWLPMSQEKTHELSSSTISLILRSNLFSPSHYLSLPFNSILGINTATVRWLFNHQDPEFIVSNACLEMRTLVQLTNRYEPDPPDWRPLYATMRDLNLCMSARAEDSEEDKVQSGEVDLLHNNAFFMASLATVSHIRGRLLSQTIVAMMELLASTGQRHRNGPSELYKTLQGQFLEYVKGWQHPTMIEEHYLERGYVIHRLLMHWPDLLDMLPMKWVHDPTFQEHFLRPLPQNWSRCFWATSGSESLGALIKPPSYGEATEMPHGPVSQGSIMCFFVNHATQMTTFYNPLSGRASSRVSIR